MQAPHLSAGIAFLAGLVSFVSPCVLPLVPAYLSFLTGSSLEDLKAESSAQARIDTLLQALAFILGFTIIFVLLGISASALGGLLRANQMLIAQIGGLIVIVLGLQMMGLLRVPFLMMDARIHAQHKRRGFTTSILVGMAFAAGWSPCIGPILAAILALASSAHTTEAAGYLLAYSAGLAVPFFATALALGTMLPLLNRIKPALPKIEFAAGLFLVIVGLVLVNNAFLIIAGKLYQIVPQPQL